MTIYLGNELELFQHASNWKRYWSRRLLPFVSGKVLEVGSGIGGNLSYLNTSAVSSWHALEPDSSMAETIATAFPDVTVTCGTIDDTDDQYDTVLYIDVLEHIETDSQELKKAATRLNVNGYLIVLGPAHQGLFSEFDQAIGHYRRYNRASLLAITPSEVEIEKMFYLDSIGLIASVANRFLLKESEPGSKQIGFWDKIMVPCSRVFDPLFGYRLGKTIVAIWRKTG